MKQFGNVFMLISIKENDKLFAYAEKVRASVNLAWYITGIKNVATVNVCQTWKEATETAAAWNESYKRNGSYLFS